MEISALFQQFQIKRLIVVVHHLSDNRQSGIFRLKKNYSSFSFSSCPSTHLRHHHKGMLVSSKVWIVEHRVSIQDAHHSHLVEVQAFAYHLCSYQQIGLACRKIRNQSLIGITSASSIKIHSGDASLWKYLSNLVFYLLRTIASPHQFSATTVWTFSRHRISIATIMACKQIDTFV